MFQRTLAFLTGLPRSGSTVLCNILGMHPEIIATPTSPLASLVETLRQTWSAEEALLAQLDHDGERVYQRLARSLRAFMEVWSSDDAKPVTVDKSRSWLFLVEILKALYPDFKMIVCLRDLRDVYCSIEKQHRKTILLTFPGPKEANLVDQRAVQLFLPNGVIGGPLRALQNLVDVPHLENNLFFWHFERFLADPYEVTGKLLEWLGVSLTRIDLSHIHQSTHEADSYYRLKYPHTVATTLRPPGTFREAEVSPRILAGIAERFGWYYRLFYAKDGVRLSGEGLGSGLAGLGDGAFAADAKDG